MIEFHIGARLRQSAALLPIPRAVAAHFSRRLEVVVARYGLVRLGVVGLEEQQASENQDADHCKQR